MFFVLSASLAPKGTGKLIIDASVKDDDEIEEAFDSWLGTIGGLKSGVSMEMFNSYIVEEDGSIDSELPDVWAKRMLEAHACSSRSFGSWDRDDFVNAMINCDRAYREDSTTTAVKAIYYVENNHEDWRMLRDALDDGDDDDFNNIEVVDDDVADRAREAFLEGNNISEYIQGYIDWDKVTDDFEEDSGTITVGDSNYYVIG